jgi:hypothetical protein
MCLGLWPNQLNLFWVKGVFGKTHLYAQPLLFHPFLFWYLAKQSFLNIKKIQKKICGPLWIYLWIPHVFFYDFTVYLIYEFYYEMQICYAIHACLFLFTKK